MERIPIAPKIKSVFSSFSHRWGFTLAELITTMAIVAILAGMVLPRFLSQSEKAATAEAISALGVLKRVQMQYLDENNLIFHQQPADKLNFIKQLQKENNYHSRTNNTTKQSATSGRK